MNQGKGNITGLLVIIALGLVALGWFRGEYGAVAGYDFATSLKPLDDLSRSAHLWDERLYAGAPSVLTVGTLPYFLIQYLFEAAAGSLYRGQMLFFLLLFTLPGVSMYRFLRTAFEKEREAGALSFFGAVFYMFNAYVVVKWNRGELITLFSYGLLPIYLGIVERGLKGPLNTGFLLALIVALFFFPVTLGHSADFLMVSAVIASFSAWKVVSIGTAALPRAAVLLMLTALLSLWWILPLLGAFSAPASPKSSFTGSGLEILHYYSSWASLFNLMKMWFFAMYATAVEFNNQFYRPGTIIFPLAAFAALLLKRNGYVVFFSTMAIAGLWLSKGTAPPLSGAYEWMYLNVPYFFVFRAPTRYFPLVYTLCLAVLLAYTLSKVWGCIRTDTKPRKILSYLFAAAVLGVFFFQAWPVFSRDTIFRTTKGDILYPSIFVDIPGYYDDINNWLKEREGYFRVHSFNNQSYQNYTWGYSSTDIAPKLIESPQTLIFRQELIFGASGFQSVMDAFDRAVWEWDFDRIDKMLGLLSVKYVTVIDDVMRRYQPDTNSTEILRSLLGNTKGLKEAAVIGKASIYENPYALPHFFTARKAKAVYGGPEGLLTLSNTVYADTPAFILMDRLSSLEASDAGSIDEVIFTDMNLSDIAADNIEPEYRVEDMKDIWFQANEPGRFIVMARKRSRKPFKTEKIATIDGVASRSSYDGDGMRWKTIGVWPLITGIHRIRFDSDRFSAVIAVPLRVWEQEMKIAEGRIKAVRQGQTHIIKAYGEGTSKIYLRGKGYISDLEPLEVMEPKRVLGYQEDYSMEPRFDEWLLVSDGAAAAAGKEGVYLDSCVSLKNIRVRKLLHKGFDPEEFPYADAHIKSVPEGFYDVTLSVGFDIDGNGTVDEELEALKLNADGTKTVSDLSRKLTERYGYPGRLKYTPVWAVFTAERSQKAGDFKGLRSLIIKDLSFYHEAPSFKAPSTEMTSGMEEGASEEGPGLRSIRYKGPGIIRVSEKTGQNNGQRTPQVKFRKINPSLYEVDIDAGGEPFWLVFNESYNAGWKAYIRNERDVNFISSLLWSGGAQELDRHTVMNGYANAWWVEKPVKDMKVAVEFAPERHLVRGVVLSASSAVIMVIATVSIGIVKRRRHGGNR